MTAISNQCETEPQATDLPAIFPALDCNGLEFRPIRLEDIPEVAQLHYAIFGMDEATGQSAAKLGPEFLADVFYKQNLDNPEFFCDVAMCDGRLAGFSAYSSCHRRVFRHLLRHHLLGMAWSALRGVTRNPRAWLTIVRNATYFRGEQLSFLAKTEGWWIVAGVRAEFRSTEFKRRTGILVAAELFDRMERTLAASGCRAWFGAVRPDNVAINIFLQRRGARLAGTAKSQGLTLQYYIASLDRFAATPRAVNASAPNLSPGDVEENRRV